MPEPHLQSETIELFREKNALTEHQFELLDSQIVTS